MSMDEFVKSALAVANDALATANKAMIQVAWHEKECATFRDTLKERHDAHEKRLDGIMKILWTTVFGVVGTLITALGSLLAILLKA
jgi:hypothetical protein